MGPQTETINLSPQLDFKSLIFDNKMRCNCIKKADKQTIALPMKLGKQ